MARGRYELKDWEAITTDEFQALLEEGIANKAAKKKKKTAPVKGKTAASKEKPTEENGI